MSDLHNYDHLNKADPLRIEINFDDLARQIVSMNYGSCRMMRAIIKAMREKTDKNPNGGSPLSDDIEHVLNNGVYY